MNTNEIEEVLKNNTKKDLEKLAIKVNNLIEDFAKEKGINYNYMHFERDIYSEKDRVFDSVQNSKYIDNLGEVEKTFFLMFEDCFFESLLKIKVKNLINKVNLLED